MPDPRSIVGKLLLKIKKKPTSTASSPPPTPPVPPSPTETEGDRKLDVARQQIQGGLDLLGQAIAALPFDVLKTPLDRVATTLRGQMSALDTLPDRGAKASRLMQIGEAVKRVQPDLLKAQKEGTDVQAAQRQLTTLISEVTTLLTGIAIVAARQPLTLRLNAAKQAQADALSAIDVPGLLKLPPLVAVVEQIKTDTTELQTRIATAIQNKKDWSDDPLLVLQNKVKRSSPAVKSALASAVTAAQVLAREVQTKLNAADFSGVDTVAGQVYWACDAATKRIALLEQIALLKASHDQAVLLQTTVKKHPQFSSAFTALSTALQGPIQRAKTLLDTGESASSTDLKARIEELEPCERAVRKSLAEYDNYQNQRKGIATLIEGLKKHAQHGAIQPEISQIEGALGEADRLGPLADGGWHRAKVALAPLAGRCAQAKTLADKLATEAGKLPALTQKLEEQGIDKGKVAKVANMALKLLVEEGCDADTAVTMAKSASTFADEGLDEPDALLSARVKQSLCTGDDALSEEHAHAIGKNVRGRGTADIEDIRCVAQEMKRMSPKALEALNQAGVVTGICRGPVTDMIPELADVNPRGWGSRTWDEVPGCYMGSKQMVVVGTMDNGGKRKVPGDGEGPIPHGTPDLIGHEAGHAYDVVGGMNRRNNPLFVAARTQDVSEAPPQGLTPGRDDYFMTKTESPTGKQTGDDGARSETFAESFALHFAGKSSKWPHLMAFWQSNPWGV